jgi:hypothetical protein
VWNYVINLLIVSDCQSILDGEMSIQEIGEIRKVTERKLVNGTTMEGRRRGVSSISVKRRIKRKNVKKKEMAGSSFDEDVENERTAREIRVEEETESLADQREERAREIERERKEERPPSPRVTRFGGDRGVVSSGGVDTSSDRESVDQILEQVVSVKVEQKEDLAEQQQNEKKLETVLVKEEKILEAVPIKEEHEEEEPEQEEEKVEEPLKKEKPLSILIPKVEKDSSGDPLSQPPSRTSPACFQKSPGKANLCLPDQTGLIVGVNTINYDVSIRIKRYTREEKKMEMIMQAIEAMERAEFRKSSAGRDSSSDKLEKKRRKSNSVKTGGNSGAAEVRRRSRAKSDDSSALSEAETADDVGPLAVPLNTISTLNCDKPEQLKFPSQKKTVVDAEANDDVSKQYLRGSRSPPGIANHLQRSAKTEKNTHQTQEKKPEEKSQTSDKIIGCSAKKRWLRAAMSEDTSEENHVTGNIVAEDLIGSASPEPDYTPLKKRRLATYNETEEQMKVPSEIATAVVFEVCQTVSYEECHKVHDQVTTDLNEVEEDAGDSNSPGVDIG